MPVLPSALTPPSLLFSFTDFSTANPDSQQPGDRMDAQQNENRRSISDIIGIIQNILRADGAIKNKSVGIDQLSDAVVAMLNAPVDIVLPPDIQQAVNDAQAARDAAQASQAAAGTSATNAANDRAAANISAGQAANSAALAAATVATAGTIATGFAAAQTALTNAKNAADDSVADAQLAEQLAWLWSEKLDGPVLTEAEYAAIDPELKPPGYFYNPVGGVAGLWSAHWWAVQTKILSDNVQDDAAAAAASATSAGTSATNAAASAAQARADLLDFERHYLGAKNVDPLVDNEGNPLTQGALYWSTATASMRAYSAGAWHDVASGGGGGIPDAPVDGLIYGRKDGAWTQIAGGGGGIPDAPVDGTDWLRKNGAWSHPDFSSIVWPLPGTPADFPPSAHTHAIADVTGLTGQLAAINTSLGNKANTLSPTFTGTAAFANMTTSGTATWGGVSTFNAAAVFNAAVTFGGGGSLTVPDQAALDHSGLAANTKYVDDAITVVTTGGPIVHGPALTTNNGLVLWNSVNGTLVKTGAVPATIATSGLFSDLLSTPAAISALATLTPAADRLPYFTGSSAASLTVLTSFARTLLDDTDAATMRATISAEEFGKVAGLDTQTASFTLVLGDLGKVVEMNVAGANNLTIPPNSSVAFPVNSRIDIVQLGAGQTTLVAGAGVTLRSAGGNLKLGRQYSGVSVYKRATDEWVVFGDLVA